MKETASQTERFTETIGSQTTIFNGEFSTHSETGAHEIGNQTEISNSEAGSQTDIGISRMTQTNQVAGRDDKQPECLDSDKADKLIADNRTRNEKSITVTTAETMNMETAFLAHCGCTENATLEAKRTKIVNKKVKTGNDPKV